MVRNYTKWVVRLYFRTVHLVKGTVDNFTPDSHNHERNRI